MLRSACFCIAVVLLALAGADARAESGVNHVTACSGGVAGGYPCAKVDLAAQLTLAELGATAGQEGNDIWGWTDATTQREYALVGVGNGTAFVDITAPDHPTVLGFLPTHTSNSLWRDIKVYADHAFIVSEAVNHGMQVFDLRRLRTVVAPPANFTADAHYPGFGRAHNIVINEQTGFAYAVGSVQGVTTCAGGLHMIDVSNPLTPTFAGCFSADGYTHDAQCVVYEGPDTDYLGRELCFNSNEDTLTIVDVSNKAAPVQIARVGYVGSDYSHQGWLTPDQRWFLMDDELDELGNGHNTRTYVWDLADLDDPKQTFSYTAAVAATDHNLYVRDQYAFLANYKSGLRILDLSGIEQGQIEEVAFFDTYPANNNTGFDGAWSSYPFFASGNVIVSDISRGLFVLQPQLCQEPAVAGGLVATAGDDNVIDIAWSAAPTPGASYEVYRELGGCGVGPGTRIAEGLSASNFSDTQASGQVEYGYRVRVVAAGGQCRSGFSACVAASTTGVCNAPPRFDGLRDASTASASRCTVELAWDAAMPSCSGPAQYELHRANEADFVPGPSTLIRQAIDALETRDHDVQSGVEYFYAVRARDSGNGVADDNLLRRSVTPHGEIIAGTWSNGAEQGEDFLGAGSVMPQHVAWHSTDAIAHSGERSYVSGYANASCIALTTPPIDLGVAGNSNLTFHQRYGIESGWDGGRIEISSDGSNWTALQPGGGYPQQITNAGNACGWPVGTPVFAGSALTWQQQTVDLAGHAGEVRLRWVFSTDSAVVDAGWWIDSINVTPAQISGACSTVPWATMLSISASMPASSVVGQTLQVDFELQVDPQEGEPPTGNVSVTADGGAETCQAALPQSGCEVLWLEPGERTLFAAYSGDDVFPPASIEVMHHVERAAANLEISWASPVDLQIGAVPVPISIEGGGNLPSPSGTVQVRSDLEDAECTIVLPENACSLILREGLHTLSATYSGDGYHLPAQAQSIRSVVATAAVFDNGFE